MKTYRGKRTKTGTAVYVKTDKSLKILQPYLHWMNHSPTGLEWGYEGSGPSQLALAILANHTHDKERTLNAYMTFKWKVTAALPGKEWELSEEEVEGALTAIERNHELPPIRALEE